MSAEAIYPDLAGRAALVTGGADGIGRAIVEALIRQKVKVAFLDLDRERGEALAAECWLRPAERSRSNPSTCATSPRRRPRSAAREVCGPFSIGVNNAGHDERHAFEDRDAGILG
jgi:NAD(P)-dependent dehydrogenase (short-subunit alcohol dehydrogenase family)